MPHKNTYSLLFLLLLMVVMGCSKKEDIDPQDQYVGTYAVTINYTQKITATGATTTGTQSASLPFVKGTAADEMTITDASGTRTTIKLSGSNFTVVPYTALGIISGASVTFTIAGSESFLGKSTSMTST